MAVEAAALVTVVHDQIVEQAVRPACPGGQRSGCACGANPPSEFVNKLCGTRQLAGWARSLTTGIRLVSSVRSETRGEGTDERRKTNFAAG